MPIRREKDRRNGRTHLLIEKCWPHGNGRYRRRFQLAEKTIAKALDRKIESAIADTTWPELKRQLDDPPPKPVTVAEFADTYFAGYCVEQKNDLGFKRFNLNPIKRILGDVPVEEVRRKHGHLFVKERRKDGVANGTINRGIAVLSNMLNQAIEQELLTVNPIAR